MLRKLVNFFRRPALPPLTPKQKLLQFIQDNPDVLNYLRLRAALHRRWCKGQKFQKLIQRSYHEGAVRTLESLYKEEA